MAAWIVGVVAALASFAGVAVTAVLARRSSRDQASVAAQAAQVQASVSFRDDFVTFVGELKQQVERLEAGVTSRDEKIKALETEVARCEKGRAEDRVVMSRQADAIHILEAKVAELGG